MSKPRIMIVDDNRDHLTVMEMALEDEFDITTAHDAAQAREVLKESVPQLIITDILMPGESGYSFIAYLKASGVFKNIPIVATSSLNAADESLKEGADVFLPKPFETDDLLQLVKQLIQEEDLAGQVKQAMAFLKDGRIEEARTLFTATLKEGREGHLLAYSAFYLGEISRTMGNNEEAELYYKKAIDIRPRFWPAYTQLGKLAYKSQNRNGAIAYWEKSLEIKPDQTQIIKTLKELRS